jgi:hypothetical protein
MSKLFGTFLGDGRAECRTLKANHQIKGVVQSISGSIGLLLQGDDVEGYTLKLLVGPGSTAYPDHEVFRVSLSDALQLSSTHVNDSAIGPVTVATLITCIDLLKSMQTKIANIGKTLDKVYQIVSASVGYGDLAKPLGEASVSLNDIEDARKLTLRQLEVLFEPKSL